MKRVASFIALVGLLISGDAVARDLVPGSFAGQSQQLVYADGSQRVLRPNDPRQWVQLDWRLRYEHNVSTPGITFENFDFRVVRDEPGNSAWMEVSFEPQASFSGSPPCSGHPTVIAELRSKAGDLVLPVISFGADVYKHQVGPRLHHRSEPIRNYQLNQVGSVTLRSSTIAGDCGD